MLIAFIIIAFALVLIWSIFLPFYKEKKIDLLPDEDRCFSPECKTIEIKKGNNKAILFIHGFPTTPYMYSWASEYASNHGYDTFVPLIPTFGSDYKDMLKTNFSSWFSYIDNYYKNLHDKYEKIYVVGVSMGGAITLKLAEKYSEAESQMNGIAVLSAPVVYNSIKDGIITNPLGYFARIIGLFIPAIMPRPTTSIPSHNDGDENWHGYRGIFIKQGISLFYNFKQIRKELYKISVPMIAGHERSDKTVPFKNLEIIKKETNTNSIFFETEMGDGLIHSHHALLSYDSTKKILMDKILSFFAEA